MSKLQLTAAAQTNSGKNLTKNEDSFLLGNTAVYARNEASATVENACECLLLVCDGIGGEQAGNIASATAVRFFQKNRELLLKKLSDAWLNKAVLKANEWVCRRAADLGKSMGSTLALVAFKADKWMVTNVGDSRVYLYRDGVLKQLSKDHTGAQSLVDMGVVSAEKAKGIVHAWQFGPALIQDGEICQKFASYGTKHPRLILGYYEPGHYVVVAVDGRSKTSVGMSSSEMAELMKALGCKEAMNLDGGTSAVMTFMGKVISNPSGEDKDGDGRAGRNLKDMILFAEYDSEGNAPALSDLPSEKYKVK